MATTPRPSRRPVPAGRAPAPGRAVDATVAYVVHRALRRDLDDLVVATRNTPVLDRATWRALERRWLLLARVLHRHLAGEAATGWPWPERQPGTAATVPDADLVVLLGSCRDGLARVARTADEDTRAALAVRVVALRQQVGRHLAAEEGEALEEARHLLLERGWPLDRPAGPAMGLRQSLRLVPWALHDLPAEARAAVLAGPGGRRVRVLAWLGRPWFARGQRRAFRHVER